MPSKMTKKQKVQNFTTKNPEADLHEIANKAGCTPAYAGQIRRELAARGLLPPLKRGRKAKSEAKPKTNPIIEAQRAAWEEFEADMLLRDVVARDAKPSLFRRMLTALGLQ